MNTVKNALPEVIQNINQSFALYICLFICTLYGTAWTVTDFFTYREKRSEKDVCNVHAEC